MKEVVITSIGSKDGKIEGNIWEVRFTVKQSTPISYELKGALDWEGFPILEDIQNFVDKLTQEVKIKRKRTK